MNKKELGKLSKNQLIDIILELTERLEAIESYLKAYENPHTPPSQQKKNSKPPQQADRFPGKPKGGNGGGLSLPKPDQQEDHTLDTCQSCKSLLGEPYKQTCYKRLDLPKQLALCTLHVIHHYHRPCCAADAAAASPKGKCGLRIKSFCASLKEKGLFCQETARTIREMGFVSFSVATVVAIMLFFADCLQPLRNWLEKEALKAHFLHADETGLRRDGQNGHVLGIFTPGIALLYAELSRGKHVAERLPGTYDGVTATDGYADYFMLMTLC